jgi:hypothetical protein
LRPTSTSTDAVLRRPGAGPGGAAEQIRGYVFKPNSENLRRDFPDWVDLQDGLYSMTGEDEGGETFAYKLAVRKTPTEWFFLAYDMTQARRGEQRFDRALVGVGGGVHRAVAADRLVGGVAGDEPGVGAGAPAQAVAAQQPARIAGHPLPG